MDPSGSDSFPEPGPEPSLSDALSESWSDSALGDAGRESISEPAERLRPDCRDSLSDCSEPEGLRFLAGWSLSESSSEWGLRGRRGLPASLPDLFWFSSESLSEEAPFFRRSPSSESLLLWLLRGCLAKRNARYMPGSGGQHLTSRGCAFKREGQNILDLIGACTMIFLWCTFFGK